MIPQLFLLLKVSPDSMIPPREMLLSVPIVSPVHQVEQQEGQREQQPESCNLQVVHGSIINKSQNLISAANLYLVYQSRILYLKICCILYSDVDRAGKWDISTKIDKVFFPVFFFSFNVQDIKSFYFLDFKFIIGIYFVKLVLHCIVYYVVYLDKLSILETELKDVPARVAAFSRSFLKLFGVLQMKAPIIKNHLNFSFARKQYINWRKSDNFFSV